MTQAVLPVLYTNLPCVARLQGGITSARQSGLFGWCIAGYSEVHDSLMRGLAVLSCVDWADVEQQAHYQEPF